MTINIYKFYHFLRTFIDKRALGYVILFVTAKCNYRCRMCFYWQEATKKGNSSALRLTEIRKISQNIRQIEHLTITGGEPFTRKDIATIAECFFDNSRLQSLTITTNGSFTSRTERAVYELVSAYPDRQIRICLSLDGFGKLHDEIRGVSGAFDKVRETYNRLDRIRHKFPNFFIDSTTVFSSYNQNQIIEIIDSLNRNFKFDNYNISLVRGNPREPIAKKVNLQKYKEAIRIAEEKALLRQNRGYGLSRLYWAVKLSIRELVYRTAHENKKMVTCLAGKKMVEISESGEVLCCEILKKSLGNLRRVNYDLYELIFSPQAERIKKEIKEGKCFCHFECAIQTAVIYNPRFYPRVLKYIFKNYFYNYDFFHHYRC